jgi:hypothetical protein
MTEQLLPCPFCGSDQVSLSEGETGEGQPWPYVECENCAATATPENWNCRSPAPEGTWLWGKLMDWCRMHGASPSNYNELFAIAADAHKLNNQEPARHD